MNTQIQVYNNPEFGEIRTMVMPDGQVGFVGKDVAKVLGYRDTVNALKLHVEDEDKARWQITTQFGVKEATFINESGLYALILSSKLPKAREFKHWVTAVVLPQIRQTGGYINVSDKDDDNAILSKALMIAQRTIEQREQLLESQRPLVRFAEAVTASGDSIMIGELAKLLTQNGHEIGRTRLFRWLRENGYLFKHSTAPIQKWVEKGIFETNETLVQTNHGDRINITTKVTGKGQQYFINLLVG